MRALLQQQQNDSVTPVPALLDLPIADISSAVPRDTSNNGTSQPSDSGAWAAGSDVTGLKNLMSDPSIRGLLPPGAADMITSIPADGGGTNVPFFTPVGGLGITGTNSNGKPLTPAQVVSQGGVSDKKSAIFTVSNLPCSPASRSGRRC